MCSRVSRPSRQKIKDTFPTLDIGIVDANYHVLGFDNEMLPVVTNLEPDKVQMALWGFNPGNQNTLNARNDTLFELPTYKKAAATQRCVIIVDGFFEFKTKNGVKYPHFIGKKAKQTFTFGGIWQICNGQLTCSIITTDANELLSDIHNEKLRMPFVIAEDQWSQWLDINTPIETIKELMKPHPVDDLIAWQVGGMITQRGLDKNTPEIQDPVGPAFSKAPFPDPIPTGKEKKPRATKQPASPPNQQSLF